tara:strand:+ start:268 stop:474 length:207 start_codon:yes stop_codon:yes gene_type:complete
MKDHFLYLVDSHGAERGKWIYRLYVLVELNIVDYVLAYQSTIPENTLDKYRRLQNQGHTIKVEFEEIQ